MNSSSPASQGYNKRSNCLHWTYFSNKSLNQYFTLIPTSGEIVSTSGKMILPEGETISLKVDVTFPLVCAPSTKAKTDHTLGESYVTQSERGFTLKRSFVNQGMCLLHPWGKLYYPNRISLHFKGVPFSP
ncbi:MAG: hypothetical protein WCH34_15680 [Bacteroidota bacterium]